MELPRLPHGHHCPDQYRRNTAIKAAGALGPSIVDLEIGRVGKGTFGTEGLREELEAKN